MSHTEGGEPLGTKKPDIIKIVEMVTGVPIEMVIDAAGDPQKEQQLLRHISEKIKEETRNGKF